MKNILLLLLFTTFSTLLAIGQANEVERVETPIFTFQTYGMPKLSLDAEKIVDREWGIRRVSVAGCVVSKELVERVKANNALTTKYLTDYYGLDWEKRYNNHLSLEKKNVKKVEKLLAKDGRLNIKKDELSATSDYHYTEIMKSGPIYYVYLMTYQNKKVELAISVNIDSDQIIVMDY